MLTAIMSTRVVATGGPCRADNKVMHGLRVLYLISRHALSKTPTVSKIKTVLGASPKTRQASVNVNDGECHGKTTSHMRQSW
jgi:hypothetical protein